VSPQGDDNARSEITRGKFLADALLQIGFFLVMLVIPCAVFVLATIVAGELRDFFESTSLSVATHLVCTVLFAMGLNQIIAALITTTDTQFLSLVISVEYVVIVLAWLAGAHGCLYGDQSPRKRIGPRGLKRYR
jgi:hypothetical protein